MNRFVDLIFNAWMIDSFIAKGENPISSATVQTANNCSGSLDILRVISFFFFPIPD